MIWRGRSSFRQGFLLTDDEWRVFENRIFISILMLYMNVQEQINEYIAL